jgi:hypothetical protein
MLLSKNICVVRNSQVVEKVSLVREDENISYITPTINPLSCTVVIVETGHNIWLYDTGSHSDIPAMINSYNQAEKNINIVPGIYSFFV